MPVTKKSKKQAKADASTILEAKALRLRVEGRKYSEIGKLCGKSEVWAWRVVTARLKKLASSLREDTLQLRQLEMTRLDKVQEDTQAIAASALKVNDRKTALRAQEVILKTMSQRAALLGLNAPIALHNVDLSTLTDEQLRRIAAGEPAWEVLQTPTMLQSTPGDSLEAPN